MVKLQYAEGKRDMTGYMQSNDFEFIPPVNSFFPKLPTSVKV